jgi:hypothetical protein
MEPNVRNFPRLCPAADILPAVRSALEEQRRIAGARHLVFPNLCFGKNPVRLVSGGRPSGDVSYCQTRSIQWVVGAVWHSAYPAPATKESKGLRLNAVTP